MEKRPFTVLPAKSDNTYLYLFSYEGDETDFVADKAAYETALKLHFMIDQPVAVEENGLGVGGDTERAAQLTISFVATARTIALAAGALPATGEVAYPVCFYKGEAIPFSDYATITPATGLITLIADTVTKYPSVLGSDYQVYYSDHVNGILVSADVGGLSLPIESTSYKAVGHVEPVVEVERRGDAEGTGTISVITALQSIMFDSGTVPLNAAGEELFARIYGTDWTANAGWSARQKLNFNSKPFGICIVMLSGKSLTGGDAGHIWGRIVCIYHCQLTSISSPQNVTNDTTDPILQNVEFRAKYPNPEFTTILTT